MAVTATNTAPTTIPVQDLGSRCGLSVFIWTIDRATLAKWPRRGCSPGAAEVGRIRALTPRPVPGSSFLAAPCWRDPSHAASDGEDRQPRKSPDQGRLRSASMMPT